MAETIHIAAKVRRFGNSLAIIIPARQAREARIEEGTPVQVDVRSDKPGLAGIFGLLKGLPYEEFRRAELYDEDD